MIRTIVVALVVPAATISLLGAAYLPPTSEPLAHVTPPSPSALEEAITKSAERPAGRPTSFRSDSLSFSVRFHGEVSPYRVLGVYVRPGERVTMRIEHGDAGPYVGLADAGSLTSMGARGWEWEAPESTGLHRVAVLHAQTGEAMIFNAFVIVPHEHVECGTLNGYRIGEYPQSRVDDMTGTSALSANYAAPLGYIEVTRENENTLISPHFRLKQFVCKQAGDYPRYIVLRERLLLKLERLLAMVNESGVPAQSFHVMSGYRTPFYNASIGNVKLSRHQFGDAADIFIDENGDGVMDDVNGDRRVDKRDSDWLRGIVEMLHEGPGGEELMGGVGLYASTAEHGPFVHVDTRGRRAQW